MPTTDMINLRQAYARGEQVAKANVTGYLFIGAWPEAQKLGYSRHSLEYQIFTTAFLANLNRPVVTDREGRLI